MSTPASQFVVDKGTIRILHVDDEPDFADLTATMLERTDHRYEVETATAPADVLDQLTISEFDCVVCDYDMPGPNGIELLTNLREAGIDIPFILFTGKGSEEVASEAVSAGVTDYLQKEVGSHQFTVLANRVENAIDHHRSQELVERNHTRLREIIDALPHLLYVIDENGRYLVANSALADFHGMEVDKIEGKRVEEVLTHDEARQFRHDLDDVLSCESALHPTERRVVDSSGRERIFEGRLVRYDIGRTDRQAVLGIAADITDRQEREDELEDMMRRLDIVLEASKFGLFDWNVAANTISFDDQVAEILGYSPDDFPDDLEHWRRLTHSDDLEQVQSNLALLFSSEVEFSRSEYRMQSKDGKWLWIESVGTVVEWTEDGNPVRVLGIHRDISDRKQQEFAVRKKERRYQRILAHSSDYVIIVDETGCVDYASPAIERVTGYEPADVVGTEAFEYVHQDDLETAATAFAECLDNPHEEVNAEYRSQTADGTYQWVEVRGANHLDDREIDGILVNVRSIGSRKSREHEFEEYHDYIDDIMDSFEDVLVVHDEKGVLLRWNQTLVEQTGFSDETLASMTGPDLIPPADRDRAIEKMSEALDNGPVRLEAPLLRSDGSTIPYEFLGTSVTGPSGDVRLVGIGRDVSDRAAYEDRLRALNERTQDLVAASTRKEVAQIATEAARDILGLQANSIHFLSDDELALVPVAYTDATIDLIGEPPPLPKNDSIAWQSYIEGKVHAIHKPGDHPAAHNPDTPVVSELYLPLGEHGILLVGSVEEAAFDDRDQVLGEILAGNAEAALDSVSRTAELQARERELSRQNERLDRFASVVSHDLRNPLNVADGQLELARSECNSGHLAKIRKAHNRMDTLIADLLALSRAGESVGELEPIDLDEAVERCWASVTSNDATFSSTANGSVNADPSRLRQLFENLMRNALEHGGNDVTIRVERCEDGFYVEDDGPGIPPDIRRNVFEPGFTTSDDGVGLGLSIVKEIADAHGWTATITDSEIGGTRFEFTGIEFTSR